MSVEAGERDGGAGEGGTTPPGRAESRALPVAVIGAGPVGLSAAAHLAAKGQAFVVNVA